MSSDGGECFQSAILKWSKDVEGISKFEKTSLRENPWLKGRAKTLMAVVANVGGALRSFLKKFPKMEAVACNILLFSGATIAIADLFLDALVIRAQKTLTSSSITQAKTFAMETYLYVKPRLEKLNINGEDGVLNGHHSHSDIEDCIGRLLHIKHVMENGISKLDRSSVVASSLNIILGAAGITGFAIFGVRWSSVIVCFIPCMILNRVADNYTNMKRHFGTYQGTCQEIIEVLNMAKK